MEKLRKLKLPESWFKWRILSRKKFHKLKAAIIEGETITNALPTIEQFKTVKISNQI
jgi:hypothetical protein